MFGASGDAASPGAAGTLTRKRAASMLIECYFCGAKLPDADTASAAGWASEFYRAAPEGPQLVSEPACPSYQAAHLRRNDGELTLVEPDPVEEAVRGVWERHFRFP